MHKHIYINNNYVLFNILFFRKLFRKKWICKHSSYRKKPGSEKNAQCESFIDASIKNITKGTVRKDSFLKMEPPLTCLLRINLNHTHDTESANALRQLDVLPEVINIFFIIL